MPAEKTTTAMTHAELESVLSELRPEFPRLRLTLGRSESVSYLFCDGQTNATPDSHKKYLSESRLLSRSWQTMCRDDAKALLRVLAESSQISFARIAKEAGLELTNAY